MKNYLGMIALGLSALLLSGCVAPRKGEDSSPQQARRNKISHDITSICFESYNPPPSADALPIPDKDLELVVKNGLDAISQYALNEDVVLENKGRFIEDVLKDIKEKFGYDREQLSRLSPKDSVDLALRLVASKFEYYGESNKKEMSNDIARLTKEIEDLEKQVDKPDADKEKIGKEIETKKILLTQNKILLSLTSSVQSFAGLATTQFDDVPADKLYADTPEIVCRHYSKVAKAVFSMLKEMNPGLANTYMSCYSNRFVDLPHLWVQVATVMPGTTLITFADPTWLRSMGKVEAYDEMHLGKGLAGLDMQLANLYLQLYKSHKEQSSQRSLSFFARRALEYSRAVGTQSGLLFDAKKTEAELLRMMGQKRESIAVLENLADQLTSPDKMLSAADMIYEHAPKRAERVYRRWLAENAGEDNLKTIDVYAKIGDEEGVLREAKKILAEKDALNVFLVESAASILKKKDNYKMALMLYEALFDRTKDYLYKMEQASCIMETQGLPAALILLDDALKDPSIPSIMPSLESPAKNYRTYLLFYKAHLSVLAKKRSSAEKYFQEFLDATKTDPVYRDPAMNKMNRFFEDVAREYLGKRKQRQQKD